MKYMSAADLFISGWEDAENVKVSAVETQEKQHYNKEHITYKEVHNTRTEDATGSKVTSKVTEDQEFPKNSRCHGNRKNA